LNCANFAQPQHSTGKNGHGHATGVNPAPEGNSTAPGQSTEQPPDTWAAAPVAALKNIKRKGIFMNITLGLTPLVSLIAGILILIMPRLLNFIVAVYLIVIGLIGLFGAGSYHF